MNPISPSLEGAEGILMWGFWDGNHVRPPSAIADGPDCIPNEAGDAYIDIYTNKFQTHLQVQNQSRNLYLIY